MKRYIALLLALTLLVGCGAPKDTPSSTPAPESSEQPSSMVEEAPKKEVEKGPFFAPVTEPDNYLGGLTLAQMEEDYDYFWDTINENYPFLGVVERNGMDLEFLYEAGKEELATIQTDKDFVDFWDRLGAQFQFAGHMSTIYSAEYYDSMEETYRFVIENIGEDESLEELGHCIPLYETLTNPRSTEAYSRMRDWETQKLIDAGVDPSKQENPFKEDFENNLEIKMIEEGRIAYIAVNSFLGDFSGDIPVWEDLYSQIGDYEHLIIDISQNSGGSDLYWNTLIADPLLTKPTTHTTYMLYNDTPMIREYLAYDGMDSIAKPVSALPNDFTVNSDDLEHLNKLIALKSEFNPKPLSPFNGKIWVLVGPAVYSSSESFAMFCQDTNFATLVGRPTGGDGGGIDPFFFSLPNSGLIWRNSILYSLNNEGQNSEECGTTPDILSPEGETPLETCLKEIG